MKTYEDEWDLDGPTNWLCSFFGHDYDKTGMWYYSVYRCCRCGEQHPEPVGPWYAKLWQSATWRIFMYFHECWREYKLSKERCVDCGFANWEGDHDGCIPF
jgi:hypothetical protein